MIISNEVQFVHVILTLGVTAAQVSACFCRTFYMTYSDNDNINASSFSRYACDLEKRFAQNVQIFRLLWYIGNKPYIDLPAIFVMIQEATCKRNQTK